MSATVRPASNSGSSDVDGGDSEVPARTGGRWLLLGVVAAAVLLIDQLTKWWAVTALDSGPIDLIWTLRLRLIHNYGSAFSLNEGRGLLISLLALAAVGILLATGRRAREPRAVLALGLILGGAVGNLVDRALREGDGLMGGGVVDFIDLQWWPVFNIADAAVVIGAGLLFMTSWQASEES